MLIVMTSHAIEVHGTARKDLGLMDNNTDEFVWFIKGRDLQDTLPVCRIVESDPFHDTGESD